jgi:HEAT repeat protein
MVEAVKAALKDESADVRRMAADSLAQLRRTRFAKGAVLPLLDLVQNDDDPKVRERALNSLACLRLDAKEAAEPLTKLLFSERDDEARVGLVTTLYHIAPSDKVVVTALTKSMKDDAARVRLHSAHGLCRAISLGAYKDIAVPALIDALKDDASSVRRVAATGLGDAGASAKKALPTLEKLVRDALAEDFEYQEALRRAIDQIRKAINANQ